MAWISDTLPGVDGGTGDAGLQDLLKRMVEPDTGEIDNILKIHALHPAGMEAHFALYRAVMSGTATLRKVDRELIALQVSSLNECHY